MSLKSEIYKMGYVYTDTKGKGNVKYIKTDYEIYCKVTVKAKMFGVQVDKKSKTFKVPIALKSFMTYKTTTSVKDVTENVVSEANVNNSFYDATTDDILGGRKEILGW